MATARKLDQPDLFQGKPLYGLVPSVREDIDLMSWPFFSLSKSPRQEPNEFRRQVGDREIYVKISPGPEGMATIWDNDILIYLRTLLLDARNKGEPVGREFVFSVHDCLRVIGRYDGGQEYGLFKQALQRLKTTTINTTINADNIVEDQAVGFIDSYAIRGRKNQKGQTSPGSCRIVVSEWMFKCMNDAKRALSLDPIYFDLKGGLERKLYEIVRRHLGQQSFFHISLDKLHEQTGALIIQREFRYKLRKIAEDGLPGLSLSIVPAAGLPRLNRTLEALAAPSPATRSKREKLYLLVRPAA